MLHIILPAIRTGRYTHAKRARDIAEVKRLEKEEQLKQAGILHCTSLEKDQQYETLYVHLADSLASTSLYTEAFFTKLPQREAMYLVSCNILLKSFYLQL